MKNAPTHYDEPHRRLDASRLRGEPRGAYCSPGAQQSELSLWCAKRFVVLLGVGSDARRHQIRWAGSDVVDYVFPGDHAPGFGCLLDSFDQADVE